MKLSKGDQAPDFTLFNSDKKETALHDYRGKNVIILFFPLAFSSVCTKELCGIRDNITAYNNLNTEVLAISVDSVYTLAKFKEDQGLNFTLLSDFNKEVSRAYNSLHEKFGYKMIGVSKRAAFVIDKNGVIVYEEVLEVPSEVPDFQAIQGALRAANEGVKL